MTRKQPTHPWRRFRRRRYERAGQLWRDLGTVLGQRRRIRDGAAGTALAPAFRERLLLVVTAVNHCRYCADFHIQAAARSGITPAEARWLLAGAVDACPAHEIPALLYAQQWAARDGAADTTARAELVAQYGPALTSEIELALGVIWVGNLLGNTVQRGCVSCALPSPAGLADRRLRFQVTKGAEHP
ncbi:MAG: carboxymuconolactone decarboxylase family protein [Kouleothrix sp.]|nr:carboxymuconolactone decarboxylase family protein [Kouleothrix sp.]